MTDSFDQGTSDQYKKKRKTCTACYGKKQHSVMTRQVGGGDFIGDRGYDSGNHIEMLDCSRCVGTGYEPLSAIKDDPSDCRCGLYSKDDCKNIVLEHCPAHEKKSNKVINQWNEASLFFHTIKHMPSGDAIEKVLAHDSAIRDACVNAIKNMINIQVKATEPMDAYNTGLVNGMIAAISFITGENPDYFEVEKK